MTSDIEKKLLLECKRLGVFSANFTYNRSIAGGRVNAWRLSPKKIKATVLVVHGTGVDGLYPYLGLYYHLLKNGYEVCVFDLDGHGYKSSTFFHEKYITSCLSDAIRAFSLKENKEPVYLIGHSLGGVLAIHFLANVKHIIKLAVIVSSPSSVCFTSRVFCVELSSLFFSSIREQIPHYGWNHIFPPFGFIKRKSFPIRIVNSNNPFQSLVRVKNFIDCANLQNLVTKVNCPILYSYGTNDYLSPLKQGVSLHHLTKKSKLLKVVGESHLSTIFSRVLHSSIINWFNSIS